MAFRDEVGRWLGRFKGMVSGLGGLAHSRNGPFLYSTFLFLVSSSLGDGGYPEGDFPRTEGMEFTGIRTGSAA
jgi:hypothetical protein